MTFDTVRLVLAVAFLCAGGPLAGLWMVLSSDHESFASAAPLLAVSTALSLAPFASWFWFRRSFLIALSMTFWLLWGYYFTIGMWI